MAVSRAYIVDADLDVCRSLRFLLATMAVECRWFASADAFLKIAGELPPGCILLDLNMSDDGALHVLNALTRQNLRHAVVAMTANADPAALRAAIDLGAVYHLEMPFDEADLANALRRAAARIHGEDEGAVQQSQAERLIGALDPTQTLVLRGIVAGMSTPQIAAALRLTELQARRIRAHVGERLGLQRISDMVAISTAAHLPPLRRADRKA